MYRGEPHIVSARFWGSRLRAKPKSAIFRTAWGVLSDSSRFCGFRSLCRAARQKSQGSHCEELLPGATLSLHRHAHPHEHVQKQLSEGAPERHAIASTQQHAQSLLGPNLAPDLPTTSSAPFPIPAWHPSASTASALPCHP